MSPVVWIFLGVVLGIGIAIAVGRARGLSANRTAYDMPAVAEQTAVPQINRQTQLTQGEPKVQSEPVELLFGQTGDKPALSIRAWGSGSLPSTARKLDTSSSGLMPLTPLLQAVPTLLTSAEFASGDYMRVAIDGPLAAAKDAGFLPWVRDANGQISDFARLHAPEALGTLINAAAVWQIATIVVAQKHLADISRKLDELKGVLEDIRKHQKDERRSIVRGGIKKMRELADVIKRGELPVASRVDLETCDRELVSIQDHIETDIKSLIQSIDKVTGGDKVGTGDTFKKLGVHEEKQDGRQTPHQDPRCR